MLSVCFRVNIAVLALLLSSVSAQSQTAWKDPSPHATRFVSVAKNVQLEVLDWGGSGRAVVLLAGGGHTAHIFDDFAPKLTGSCHVYGITRRGFGASGFDATQRGTDWLGQDVLEVLDVLNLERPVLVGHSFAGSELSAIANDHPERVAGLVYLDAGYSYAFDDGKGASMMDIQRLQPPEPPGPSGADLASFSALQAYYARINGFRFPEAELRAQREVAEGGAVGNQRNAPGGEMLMAVVRGGRKYNAIPAPALLLFANPHGLGAWVDKSTDSQVRAEAEAFTKGMSVLVEKQVNAVKNGVPNARVVTLAGAHHMLFLSNEADVLREIRAFLGRVR
jgi:non-heme chloroperoxidase